MNSMQIPAHVEQIIHTLNSHGYEAFAVGGCVRDTLIGRKPRRLGYYYFRKAGAGKGNVSHYQN